MKKYLISICIFTLIGCAPSGNNQQETTEGNFEKTPAEKTTKETPNSFIEMEPVPKENVDPMLENISNPEPSPVNIIYNE